MRPASSSMRREKTRKRKLIDCKIAQELADARATQREGPSFDKGSLRFGIGEGRSVDAQHMLIGFVYNVIGHVYKRA